MLGDLFILFGIVGRHAVARLEAGARHAHDRAAARHRDRDLPRQGAGVLPARAHPARAHQRLPPGAPPGARRAQALQRRGEGDAEVRPGERGSLRRARAEHLLLRRVLPGGRGDRRARDRADPLVRRQRHPRGRRDVRRGRRVHPVRRALLPAGARPEREVQHDPCPRWSPRSASSSCSIRQPAIPEPAAPRPIGRLRGEVEFDRVWFAYQDEEWVLRDVSFRVAPGEKVAIVGATGAGKTTIANLLCRFYEFQRGAIRIDGIDIREIEGEDAAAADRARAAGRVPVLGQRAREHRVRRPRARRGRGGAGAGRGRRRAARGAAAARARRGGRGARRLPVDGRAADPRVRPGAPLRPEHPDPRRGDVERGRRDRADHPGRAPPAAARAGPRS